MDVGSCNAWSAGQVVPAKEIVELISTEHPLEPLEPNYRGEVAARYRYVGTNTEIGLISSVTEPFCRDCNRARLSADGKLFTCLFATTGTDFRKPLRDGLDDDAMLAFVRRVWGIRADRYSEERAEQDADGNRSGKIEMSYIGG
jgi:cyclic pyranopterin phosphate synthase